MSDLRKKIENNVEKTKEKPKKKQSTLLPLGGAVSLWILAGWIFDVSFVYQYIILAFFCICVFVLLKLQFSEKTGKKRKEKQEEKDRVFTADFHDTDEPVSHAGIENLSKYEIILTDISKDREQIAEYRPDVAEQLKDIDDKAHKIIEYCTSHPSEQDDCDRFFGFFLPTLKKFTQLYVTLCRQGIQGDNISATMREIEYAVRTMQEGFRKQLDSLFGEEALDISTDVTVLNTILKKEGLM